MTTKNYHFGIDLVRFFAALSVTSFHLGFRSWAQQNSTSAHVFQASAQFSELVDFTWFGWVGVEIFFIISGFVIINSANGSSPVDFLKSRILRLYPAAWICAPLSAATLYFVAGDPLRKIVNPLLHSLTLFPRSPWIDGVYWTLSVEIVFYAIVFLILTTRRFAAIHLLAAGLSIWSGMFVGYLFVRDAGWIEGLPFLNWLASSDVCRLVLLQHGCLFAIGIWLWLIANNHMSSWRWVGFAIACAGGVTEVISRAMEFTQAAPYMVGKSPLLPAAVWCAGALMVYFSARYSESLTPRSKFWQSTIRRIGLMTYPLYLIHDITGPGIVRTLLGIGLPRWPALILSVIFVITLSWIVCRAIEPQMRMAIRDILNYLEKSLLLPRRNLAFLYFPGGAIAPSNGRFGRLSGRSTAG